MSETSVIDVPDDIVAANQLNEQNQMAQQQAQAAETQATAEQIASDGQAVGLDIEAPSEATAPENTSSSQAGLAAASVQFGPSSGEDIAAEAAVIAADRIENTNQGLPQEKIDDAGPGFPKGIMDPEAVPHEVSPAQAPELVKAQEDIYKAAPPTPEQ